MDSGQNDHIDNHLASDANDHPKDELSDSDRLQANMRSMEQEDARSKAAWAYAAEQEELKLTIEASNVERFLEACRKTAYG